MPDISQAVDNLISAGWSDSDIKTTVNQIRDHTDQLINDGKSDSEIESTLSQSKVLDKDGNPISLFGNSNKDITDKDIFRNFPAPNYNISETNIDDFPQSVKDIANASLGNRSTTNIKDVPKNPEPIRDFFTGKIGGGIEDTLKALSRAALFPGLIKSLTGEGSKDLSSISNPLPEIVTDPIEKGIEGIRKVSPGLAKLIGDSMAASPAFHEFATQSISNLKYYNLGKSIKAPIDISTLRDVTPTGSTAIGGARLLEQPLPNAAPTVDRMSSVEPVPIQESKPSAKLGQSGEIRPEIDPVTIEIAKNARDYGLKVGNQDIVSHANDILDQAGIPEKLRMVQPEQSELARNAAIGVAAEAKRHATEQNDPILLNRANQIINNNGLIKPSQIMFPSIDDLENFSADLNIIATNKSKSDMTKFDESSLLDIVNNEYNLNGDKVPVKSVTEDQSIRSINDEPANSEPVNSDISMSLIKRANDLGVQSSAPSFNETDWNKTLDDVFGASKYKPIDIPSDGIPSPNDILSLIPPEESSLRGLPWYGKGQPAIGVFTHLESESKIPFLTELWNTKQISDSKYIVDSLKREKEIISTIREVGKFDKPNLRNEIDLKKAGELVEKIKDYDKKTNILHYVDKNGAITIGNPKTFANAYKVKPEIGELAARGRYLFDKWYIDGSTKNAVNPNAYIDFYLPHKMTEQQRFDYVKGLRDDQRAFFQYPRSGKIFPVETNLLKVLNRYNREWARTEHLIPWQKQVAEPILKQTIETYKDTPTKTETINYVAHYIIDATRMPRNTSIDANQKMFDFVNNTVRSVNNKLADRMIRSFGADDRMGEAVSNATRKFFLNYFQRFRPLPALRNMYQRELALPFLPDGHIGMAMTQKDLWKNVNGAHDKVLLSGLMPYLDESFLSTNKLDLFQHAENGNMFIPFLNIHDGVIKDFKSGITWNKFKDNWRLHLYPDIEVKRWKELWDKGNVGDIRDLGSIDNVAAEMGRYVSAVSQFPKGPGEVPEWARSGPVAKVAWQFGTWSPMAIDYFIRLSNAAYNGPRPIRDFTNLGKVIGIAIIGDWIYKSITGSDLGLNPISNIPDKVLGGPGVTIPQELFSVAASSWNALIGEGLDNDKKGLKVFLRDRAIRELLRNKPGLYSDVKKFINPSKDKQYKSIAP